MVKNASTSKTSEDSHVLKDKGISSRDEKKIVAMKDFIFKQAHAAKA